MKNKDAMLSLHFLILCLAFLLVNSDEMMAEHNNNNGTDSENAEDKCAYSPLQLIDFKMLFVGCLGSSIAVICIIHNSLLFYTFLSSSLLRKRKLFYLTCLSLCDIVVGVSYLGIMCIQVYAEHFEILSLYFLWHEYLKIAFTVSNIIFTTASFLLVFASFERYLQSTNEDGKLFRFVSKHRILGVFLSFMCGVIFRGGIFIEVQVYHEPECQGFASMGVALSNIVTDPLYDIYRFWVRRIMTVFIPFFVLAYCNAAIVYNLRGNQKDKMVKHLILHMTSGHSKDLTRLKSRVRAATQILIIVVTCYLFANIIDVIIAFLEYMAPEALAKYDVFYTVATDVSSLLSTLSSALRLPIYIANDKLIRHEILCQVKRIYYRILCCKSQNAKQKAFDSEKRRLVYEQVEQASSTPPAINAHPMNRSKISVDSSKIRHGIGGLIFARASVTSTMHDSIDVMKCAAIYDRALSRQQSGRHSSDSSIDECLAQCVVCENPQGPHPQPGNYRRISVIDPRGGASKIKKKISAPPKLSNDFLILEANDSDAEMSKSSTSNTPVPLKKNFNDKGDVLYWSSNI